MVPVEQQVQTSKTRNDDQQKRQAVVNIPHSLGSISKGQLPAKVPCSAVVLCTDRGLESMDISIKYQYISISVSVGDGSLFVPFRYFVSLNIKLMRAAVFIFFRFSFPAPEKILVSRNFGRTIQITYKFVHSRRGAYEINRPSIRRALLEWTKEFSIGLGADLVG